MPADFRTRLSGKVSFRATIDGQDVPLTEDHIFALGGILRDGAPGYSAELRFLFDRGVLEIGPARAPAVETIEALLPGNPQDTLFLDACAVVNVIPALGDAEISINASQPYIYFIPQPLAEALRGLAKELRATTKAMRRNEVTRNAPTDKEQWLKAIEAIYRRACGEQPLADFLQVLPDDESGFTVRPVKPLQVADCAYPVAMVYIGRNDATTASPVKVTVPSSELPAVSQLIRDLAQGLPRGQLIHRATGTEEKAAIGTIVAALARAKCLTAQARPSPCWEKAAPPGASLSTYHLGHASLLVRGGETSILFDPWFLASHRGYRRQPLQPSDLPPVSAVFLTHEHWDHVHGDALLRYPVGVPVVVPKQDKGSPLYPRYGEYLELFGIEQVIELAHWESLALPDGVKVTAIPFRGEGATEEGVVRNCYLVERDNKRVFIHVDSSLDSWGKSDISDGTIERMVSQHGAVDVVYASRRQELHLGYELISDLSPLHLGRDPRRLLEVMENCHSPASYLAELARSTGCTSLVLYSEGGAEWYGDSTNFLRQDLEQPFRGHDYLWDTLEDVNAAVPAEVRLSAPDDCLALTDHGPQYIERAIGR